MSNLCKVQFPKHLMVSKNKLGNKVFKNLHVYAGAEHPHAAQTPKTIKF